jgi:hydrogenase-4 component B
MPLTAAAFLIGSVAIVGLPPLNGFVSEWVVFQALLHSGGTASALRVASVSAAGLALIGGLALACFTKVDGVVFLGRARSPAAAQATERGPLAISAMWALATACLVIGLYPALVVPLAAAVGASTIGGVSTPAGTLSDVTAALPAVSLMAISLAVLCAIVWLLRHRLGSRVPVASANTWACAGAPLTARTQYTASSYAAPLLGAFGPLAGVRTHAGPGGLHTRPIDIVLDSVVMPAWRRIGRAARQTSRLQAGRLRWYLQYVILTVIGLLLYASYSRRGP